MASLYEKLAGGIKNFFRVKGGDGEEINTSRRSLLMMATAAVSVENLPVDLQRTDPSKGAALARYHKGLTLEQWLPFDNLHALLTATDLQIPGLQIAVRSFYGDTNAGGGTFYWDANYDKATANGGTIIDPDNPGGFDGTAATRDAYLKAQGTGTGTGCWVRVGGERLTLKQFGAIGDGTTEDTGPMVAALAYLERIGGGELFVPFGDYRTRAIIKGKNITLRGAPGTVLRDGQSNSVIEINDTADHIVIDGFHITGQRVEQEGTASARGNHGIHVKAPNVTLRNISTQALRQDGLYVLHKGTAPSNLLIEDFYLGSVSRNCASVIAGRQIIFRRGTFYLDNSYAGGVDVDNGYMLFDLEPDRDNEISKGFTFEDVTFINAGTKPDNERICFGETHTGANDYALTLVRCRFLGENGAKPAALRFRPHSMVAEGVTIKNLYAQDYVFINSAAEGIAHLKNSHLSDIVIDGDNFEYYVAMGAGTSLENIRSTADSLKIGGYDDVASATNVMGHTDINTAPATHVDAAALASSNDLNGDLKDGWYRWTTDAPQNAPSGPGNDRCTMLQVSRSSSDVMQTVWRGSDDIAVYVRMSAASVFSDWHRILDTGNTTVDANGFVKAASPIVRLFADRVHNENGADTELSRAGIGQYTLKNSLGFARSGWYIQTPQDANGNILVFVAYQQDAEGTIHVQTYAPDYSSGPATAGEPVDIPAGRWIDIRLQEPSPAPDSETA